MRVAPQQRVLVIDVFSWQIHLICPADRRLGQLLLLLVIVVIIIGSLLLDVLLKNTRRLVVGRICIPIIISLVVQIVFLIVQRLFFVVHAALVRLHRVSVLRIKLGRLRNLIVRVSCNLVVFLVEIGVLRGSICSRCQSFVIVLRCRVNLHHLVREHRRSPSLHTCIQTLRTMPRNTFALRHAKPSKQNACRASHTQALFQLRAPRCTHLVSPLLDAEGFASSARGR